MSISDAQADVLFVAGKKRQLKGTDAKMSKKAKITLADLGEDDDDDDSEDDDVSVVTVKSDVYTTSHSFTYCKPNCLRIGYYMANCLLSCLSYPKVLSFHYMINCNMCTAFHLMFIILRIC